MEYKEFLDSKIQIAEKKGFDIELEDVSDLLLPHQKQTVKWAVKGARRAGFLNFGLGKTLIQIEVLRQVLNKKGGSALIVCPLGVRHEFQRDGKKININSIKYITNTDEITEDGFYITNYERIRKGDIDAKKFNAVTFDEASILRGLDTQTSEMIMSEFKNVPFRYVFTATPSPNRFLELTNYAHYLGIMDRGQILTRFFQRDSTTAGNLTLLKKRESEFWYWMSSWACFITKPSDLGYSDKGYDLPPLKIHRHLVSFDRGLIVDKKSNQVEMFKKVSKSLIDASKEKRDSLPFRIEKMNEIIKSDSESNYLIWHHLESERHEIQKSLGKDCKSVYGSQDVQQREDYLIGFSEGKYKYLSTKPKIAGSGCNFQYHCNKAIFVGIDYKFNDFIQAIHRLYRFLQQEQVEVHIIYTDAEDEILKALESKWENHSKLQNEMTDIIKKHGLNSELYREDLKRHFFNSDNREEFESNTFKAINNDNVKELKNFKDNSVDMICTSIPFGNHYEYSENFECFGHNPSNEDFFKQMDYLIPDLYRVLKAGRIAAIHVKDRIRYSYMNGTGFTSIDPFSDETAFAFRKHGFHLISRITITTDVVRENNQTYRLGWSEKCKDGTKMGTGLPEYVLLLRKAPTDSSNAYADEPVTHEKSEYTRAKWQLDAHAFWKSDGKRLLDPKFLAKKELDIIGKLWKELDFTDGYSYEKHVEVCEKLDAIGKLPTTFMALPPISRFRDDVWDDITRMKTLNTEQSRKAATKHICPLQLDLIERLIERFTNKDEIVLDPFGGIMSVPYQSVMMGRKGVGIELNKEYYKDGVKHLRNAEHKIASKTLTLF